MTGFMQTHFLFASRRRRLGVARQTGNSLPKLGSIVRFKGNAKAYAPNPPQLRRRRLAGGVLVLVAAVLVLAGCTRAPVPAPLTPAPAPPTAPAFAALPAADALPALVQAERDAARRGDLPLLAALWAEDARLVDSRGTAEPGDDYVWQGRDALLDRYTIAVFPAPPPALEAAPALEIAVSGDEATATLGVDRWRFTRRDGRWWLLELAY